MSNLIKVPVPPLPKEFLDLEQVAAAAISTVEEQRDVSDRLVLVATVAKTLEDARKALKDPHLQAGRAIDEAFKPLIERVVKCKAELSRRLVEWDAYVTRQREAERRRQEEEAARLRRAEEERAAAERAKAVAEAKAAAVEMGLDPASPEVASIIDDVSGSVVSEVVVVPTMPKAETMGGALGRTPVRMTWAITITDSNEFKRWAASVGLFNALEICLTPIREKLPAIDQPAPEIPGLKIVLQATAVATARR
jgi:hypothetical protein